MSYYFTDKYQQFVTRRYIKIRLLFPLSEDRNISSYEDIKNA